MRAFWDWNCPKCKRTFGGQPDERSFVTCHHCGAEHDVSDTVAEIKRIMDEIDEEDEEDA